MKYICDHYKTCTNPEYCDHNKAHKLDPKDLDCRESDDCAHGDKNKREFFTVTVKCIPVHIMRWRERKGT